MWHIIIDTDHQEKVAIKYAALQDGISVKKWIKDILLDAVYPKPTKILPKNITKGVEHGTVTEDSFSPGFVDK